MLLIVLNCVLPSEAALAVRPSEVMDGSLKIRGAAFLQKID